MYGKLLNSPKVWYLIPRRKWKPKIVFLFLCLFVYSCLNVSGGLCKHVYQACGVQSWGQVCSSLMVLHLIIWDSLSWNLALWIPWTIWSVNPRDHLVIVCPQLGSELCATEPGLSTWVLKFKLGSLCLYSKQISNRSHLS